MIESDTLSLALSHVPMYEFIASLRTITRYCQTTLYDTRPIANTTLQVHVRTSRAKFRKELVYCQNDGESAKLGYKRWHEGALMEQPASQKSLKHVTLEKQMPTDVKVTAKRGHTQVYVVLLRAQKLIFAILSWVRPCLLSTMHCTRATMCIYGFSRQLKVN